jgi:deoxyuridine 5'-triphosphate nucleotidohydrolase
MSQDATSLEQGCDSVRVEVRFISKDAKVPFRKRTTDAGYDLYSVENIVLPPKVSTIVHTGIQIAAPPGYYYTIEGRSSLYMAGIFPNRAIIDATYTGEALVSFVNTSDDAYIISTGERIAQMILHKQYHAEFDIVEEFSPCYNQRGTNGFGSTGK